jgi:hypothetical protein
VKASATTGPAPESTGRSSWAATDTRGLSRLLSPRSRSSPRTAWSCGWTATTLVPTPAVSLAILQRSNSRSVPRPTASSSHNPAEDRGFTYKRVHVQPARRRSGRLGHRQDTRPCYLAQFSGTINGRPGDERAVRTCSRRVTHSDSHDGVASDRHGNRRARPSAKADLVAAPRSHPTEPTMGRSWHGMRDR